VKFIYTILEELFFGAFKNGDGQRFAAIIDGASGDMGNHPAVPSHFTG
jgi:hypothetical protein